MVSIRVSFQTTNLLVGLTGLLAHALLISAALTAVRLDGEVGNIGHLDAVVAVGLHLLLSLPGCRSADA